MKHQLLLVAALLGGCGAGSVLAAAADLGLIPADLVIINADLRTADPRLPRATALAVTAGRFVVVGDRAAVAGHIGADTAVHDAGGATVLPGFVDGHTHLASGGALILGVDLYGIADKSEWLAKIAARVDAAPADSWILGGRWDYTLGESVYPTRADLDAVAPDHPVALTDIDAHSVWVNTRALELAGITGDTRAPAGGEIVRDASGQPSGILKEGAMDLLEQAASYREALSASRRALAETLGHANSLGITTVHDMSGPAALEQYRELAANGAMTMRVWFGQSGLEDPAAIAELADQRNRYAVGNAQQGPLLALGYLKLMIDGVLSTHTAAMLEPYSDEPSRSGQPFMDQATLEALVGASNDAGLPVAIHAIGDRGVRLALDAFAARGRRDLANRIEHIEILHPADTGRFAALNVAASMQPNHCTGVIGKYIGERVGAERQAHAYVWGDLLRSGARLGLSSDWPTAPLSPLAQLADAMLRESPDGLFEGQWYPDQALAFDQALFAYTQANADFTPWGASTGSISAGKWADFVVLDGALPDGPDAAIGRALQTRRVERTYLAGQTVFPIRQSAP